MAITRNQAKANPEENKTSKSFGKKADGPSKSTKAKRTKARPTTKGTANVPPPKKPTRASTRTKRAAGTPKAEGTDLINDAAPGAAPPINVSKTGFNQKATGGFSKDKDFELHQDEATDTQPPNKKSKTNSSEAKANVSSKMGNRASQYGDTQPLNKELQHGSKDAGRDPTQDPSITGFPENPSREITREALYLEEWDLAHLPDDLRRCCVSNCSRIPSPLARADDFTDQMKGMIKTHPHSGVRLLFNEARTQALSIYETMLDGNQISDTGRNGQVCGLVSLRCEGKGKAKDTGGFKPWVYRWQTSSQRNVEIPMLVVPVSHLSEIS